MASILGKAIKFITGNLDEDDLQTINQNLEILHKNQDTEFKQTTKLIIFANHLSHRYLSDLNTITTNLNKTKNFIETFKNTEDLRIILQNEIYEAGRLLNKLQIIERTIALSWSGIPNVELLTVAELQKKKIQNYLQKKKKL